MSDNQQLSALVKRVEGKHKAVCKLMNKNQPEHIQLILFDFASLLLEIYTDMLTHLELKKAN